ncbi:MAG: HEAT repeat domain-containing protein [Thermoguttaceae bacterium]
MRLWLSTVAALMMASVAQAASGEVFVLSNGGRIVGQWLNRDQLPRRHYSIQLAEGATVSIDAKEVKKVLPLKPDEVEYECIAPTYADTAEAQWALAQWCREHRLTKQREVHLQRVIELDPEHVLARRALGYNKVEGQWITHDDLMIQRGYIKYKGQWKAKQQIEVAEKKKKQEAEEQEWFLKVKRWCGWLGGNRDQQARDNLLAIDNPAAIRALTVALEKEEDSSVRRLLVESLAKIDTLESVKSLAASAVDDRSDDVRSKCLDLLEKKKRPEATAYFISRLRDKKSDNPTVNRAAECLGRMKDPTSIEPLIESLVTAHKFKVAKPGGDNSTSAAFGKGPGGGSSGLSAGGGPTIIRRFFSNQSALDALVGMTGVNFNFDQQAWRYWYASQKKSPDAANTRRN